MNYKNAFNCKRCPQSNGEKGCPMWWEFVAQDTETGKDVVQKQCGYSALPVFLVEVVKASNRPAAAVESTRNEISQQLQEGFGKVAETVAQLAPPQHRLLGRE